MDKIILDQNQLSEGARMLGLALSNTQVDQIEGYLALLQKWNRVYNLTAIKDPREMVTHHVLDSLAVGRFLTENRYLDVGTGAGLPGMMLAILFPEKQFTLLDSNSKKTSFIKQAAHQLAVKNVTVETMRIEDYQPEILFDGVVTRAFASLNDFVELCERFVKNEGVLLAMKGPKATEEVKLLNKPCEIEKVEVPFLNEERFLVRVSCY